MDLQEVYIKNMVCDRCLRVVSRELVKQGFRVHHLELGKATLEAHQANLSVLEISLSTHGFELLMDRNTRLINQIKTLIIALIQRNEIRTMRLTLSAYLTQKMGVDYAYLSNTFSVKEHLTIEKFWILQRVEKAKELLSYKEQSINEIADKLGYSSAAYLTNQFKQVTGLTPAAYRQTTHSNRNSLDWI